MALIDPDDARQGSSRKMNRKTLAWSIPLAVIGLAMVIFFFKL
ncbi:hypothetical protein [uncultured Parasphingorhabdus sp.]|tara:strand:- start:30701 stop:30829 length:129 start_codon:yes stop_codon:yes gene_type:complete